MPLAGTTHSYLAGALPTSLQVVIVGRDPFPKYATGIPFCKPNWDQQLANNCSGKYVLLSLGIDLAAAQQAHSTPQELFEKLRSNGIVFLNASYKLVGDKIRLSKHKKYLSEANEINKKFIEAAKTVRYCGEAKKINWISPISMDLCVVHPDIRNKYNPNTRERWLASWSPNALHEQLGLTPHLRGLTSTSAESKR